MNQLATQQQQAPAARERLEVIDAVPILDTSRFEHMQRVASVMARSTLMPESLYMVGKRDDKEPLPYEQILSNCFLVVNQAVRWGLDPFAVAQCVSVVHGKLCYEGKLVSAVLQAKMGMSLHHHFTGEGESMRIYLSDKPFPEEVIAELRPGYRRQDMRIFDGSVAEWKTTGSGTPWTAKNFPRMLIYRGTRDWCRIYEPALMLGVYTDDEMVDMEETTRSRAAKDVTPQPSVMERLRASQSAAQDTQDEREGFSRSFVHSETSDALTGEIMTDTDDRSFPAETSEADDMVSSAAEGEEYPPSSSPSATNDRDDETNRLIQFAKDVLPMAADPATTGAALSVIEKEWAEEIKKMSAAGQAKATSISKSMRAIFNGNASADAAIAFHAEGLGCEPEEIGGE